LTAHRIQARLGSIVERIISPPRAAIPSNVFWITARISFSSDVWRKRSEREEQHYE
jgi:hypothetical protein